jgi:hypothetical protein
LLTLNAIKRRAQRDCNRVGVRFLGGYATDAEHIAALEAKIKTHQRDYRGVAQTLITDLGKVVEDWARKFPKWHQAIQDDPPDAHELVRRLQFQYQIFRVAAPEQEVAAPLNSSICLAAGDLHQQLFLEVENQAREAWKRSFAGLGQVGQKALRPLKTIRSKLQALSYLEPRCANLIKQIDDVLSAMPKRGSIQGSLFVALTDVMQQLMTLHEGQHSGGLFGKPGRPGMFDTEVFNPFVISQPAAPPPIVAPPEDPPLLF